MKKMLVVAVLTLTVAALSGPRACAWGNGNLGCGFAMGFICCPSYLKIKVPLPPPPGFFDDDNMCCPPMMGMPRTNSLWIGTQTPPPLAGSQPVAPSWGNRVQWWPGPN